MKREQVNTIASLLTEDPDIHGGMGPSPKEMGRDEMGPSPRGPMARQGGRHPGRENAPGYEKLGGAENFTAVKVTRITQTTREAIMAFQIDKNAIESYLPLYIIALRGEPFIMSSEQQPGEWFDTNDMPVSENKVALWTKAMTEMGIPEEMMPGPSGTRPEPEPNDDPGLEGDPNIGDFEDDTDDTPSPPKNDTDDTPKPPKNDTDDTPDDLPGVKDGTYTLMDTEDDSDDDSEEDE